MNLENTQSSHNFSHKKRLLIVIPVLLVVSIGLVAYYVYSYNHQSLHELGDLDLSQCTIELGMYTDEEEMLYYTAPDSPQLRALLISMSGLEYQKTSELNAALSCGSNTVDLIIDTNTDQNYRITVYKLCVDVNSFRGNHQARYISHGGEKDNEIYQSAFSLYRGLQESDGTATK